MREIRKLDVNLLGTGRYNIRQRDIKHITIGIFLIICLSRKRGAGDESEDSLEWLNPSPVKSPRLTITTTTITSREEEEQVALVTINIVLRIQIFSWIRIQLFPDLDELKQEKRAKSSLRRTEGFLPSPEVDNINKNTSNIKSFLCTACSSDLPKILFFSLLF
jgi:hypothetical protein